MASVLAHTPCSCGRFLRNAFGSPRVQGHARCKIDTVWHQSCLERQNDYQWCITQFPRSIDEHLSVDIAYLGSNSVYSAQGVDSSCQQGSCDWPHPKHPVICPLMCHCSGPKRARWVDAASIQWDLHTAMCSEKVVHASMFALTQCSCRKQSVTRLTASCFQPGALHRELCIACALPACNM